MADDKAKAVADAQKASQADTDAYYERINAQKPTPTQAENDRAKLGFDSLKDLDDKEDDGSGEEVRDLSADRAGAYKTRSLESKK